MTRQKYDFQVHILGCLARSIILAVPLATFCGLSGSRYSYVLKAMPSGDFPYRHLVKPGQALSAITSGFAFAYQIFGYFIALSFFGGRKATEKFRYYLIILGVIDLLFASLLFVGAGIQSTYLPHTYGCGNADSMQLFNNYTLNLEPRQGGYGGSTGASSTPSVSSPSSTGGNGPDLSSSSTTSSSSHFVTPPDTPVIRCKKFMTVWSFGIALGLLLIPNAINCFYGAMNSEPEFWNTVLNSRLWTWYIPRHIIVSARYRYRCLRKRIQARNAKPFGKKAIRADTTKWARLLWPSNVMTIDSETSSPKINGLEVLLFTYPTMVSLSNNLHYSDLLNLSMASKRIRNVLLPPSDLSNRYQILHKECACEKDRDKKCCSCNVKICNTCLHTRNDTVLTTPSYHLTCAPVCTSCLLAQQIRNAYPKKAGYGNSTPPFETWNRCCVPHEPLVRIHATTQVFCQVCVGSDEEQGSASRETPANRTKFKYWIVRGWNESSQKRSNEMDAAAKLRKRLEERARREVWQRNMAQTECSECHNALPDTGPRWWLCGASRTISYRRWNTLNRNSTSCEGECYSDWHPAWAEGPAV